MKSKNDNTPAKTPMDMKPENVDEHALIVLLEVLIAAGKIEYEDVEKAWSLVYCHS